MTIVQLVVLESPPPSEYKDKFVVTSHFTVNSDSCIITRQTVIESDKVDSVIAFLNYMQDAENAMSNGSEPQSVYNHERFGDEYSDCLEFTIPDGWPLDYGDNMGCYTGSTVAYYDDAGIMKPVQLVEG